MKKIVISLACLTMASCSWQPLSTLPKVEDRPTQTSPEPAAKPEAKPVSVITPAPVKIAPKPIVHPAISSLLTQALAKQRQGKLDQSSALVERAVRIKPESPLAWNRLAFIRLQQNDWPQAEQLALKANSFSEGNSSLQLRNWRIIAEARKRQGNAAGARKASSRADTLAQ